MDRMHFIGIVVTGYIKCDLRVESEPSFILSLLKWRSQDPQMKCIYFERVDGVTLKITLNTRIQTKCVLKSVLTERIWFL